MPGHSLRCIIGVHMDKWGWTRYLSPRYHAHKIVEDIRSIGVAISQRKAFGPNLGMNELAHALRGHLFGSFFVSGGFSWIGFLTGAIVQARTGNPFIGLLVTICVGHLAATAAFQTVWWLDHRAIYRSSMPSVWRCVWEMEKDLWPIHAAGFRIALTFGLVTVPLNATWLLVLSRWAPVLAQKLPSGIWVAIIDLILVHTTFVRLMGDLFERHSHVLALRFRPRLALA